VGRCEGQFDRSDSGTASKSPSRFAGPTHMMRQYANVSGFAMPPRQGCCQQLSVRKDHRAIDYRDYVIQTRPAK